MMTKSGFVSMPRWKWITDPGAKSFQTPQAATTVLLAMVPSAAPTVPSRGIRIRLKATVSTVIVTPSRNGVRGSPAARNAPLSMKNSIIPKMPRNIARRNGRAWRCTSGAAWTTSSRAGAAKKPTAPMRTASPIAVRNAW